MNGVTIKPVLLIIFSFYLGMVASAQPTQSAQSKGIIAGRITDRSSGAITLGLENLTNEFYREQFQFAPSRGRSFTVGLLLKYF